MLSAAKVLSSRNTLMMNKIPNPYSISAVFERDLYFGLQHPDVKRLQKLLNLDIDTRVADKGVGSPGEETDYFGERTQDAVGRLQLKYEIITTTDHPGCGRVGQQTRAKLKEIFDINFTSVVHSPLIRGLLGDPPPQSQCFNIYGDFRIDGWKKESLVRCDLFQFHSDLGHTVLGWDVSVKAFVHRDWFGFDCHKFVAPKFKAALEKVVERKLANRLKTFDGCIADPPRQMRGGSAWSMHSWGIAIDLNASLNAMGNQNFEMSEEVARCFEEEGFVWGGRWKGRFTDAMHFQYATVS